MRCHLFEALYLILLSNSPKPHFWTGENGMIQRQPPVGIILVSAIERNDLYLRLPIDHECIKDLEDKG